MVEIPANITAITLKSAEPLTIDGLNITAPVGVEGGTTGPVVTGLYSAIDPAGYDAAKHDFYSHDKTANTCKRIRTPAQWTDTSGYLHFTTGTAGDIIVSREGLTAG